MRKWKPSSELPTSSAHSDWIKYRRKPLNWCKLINSALVPCVLGVFTIVYTLQQQELSNQREKQELSHQLDSYRQILFKAYIDDISKLLAKESNNQTLTDRISLAYIRTRTLTILRTLDADRKKYIVLFLYESGLIRSTSLDLRGADLNNIELVGPYNLENLYLPGVSWWNATFVDCQLKRANFDQSVMNNGRFIRSNLMSASLTEAFLNNGDFTGSTVLFTNFTGSRLVQANFLKSEVVQAIDFTDCDLLNARFTEAQLKGQRVTVSKHTFNHTRFPNGTFGPVDAHRNLLQNGDAEWNVRSFFFDMKRKMMTVFLRLPLVLNRES